MTVAPSSAQPGPARTSQMAGCRHQRTLSGGPTLRSSSRAAPGGFIGCKSSLAVRAWTFSCTRSARKRSRSTCPPPCEPARLLWLYQARCVAPPLLQPAARQARGGSSRSQPAVHSQPSREQLHSRWPLSCSVRGSDGRNSARLRCSSPRHQPADADPSLLRLLLDDVSLLICVCVCAAYGWRYCARLSFSLREGASHRSSLPWGARQVGASLTWLTHIVREYHYLPEHVVFAKDNVCLGWVG